MAAPKTTRIAGDTTQAIPQSTAAGDAPADTYDPLERVSSVNADKAAAAASTMPSRCSSVSAVSLVRVTPLRNSLKLWRSSASFWACRGKG